jgi:hypothetical protein
LFFLLFLFVCDVSLCLSPSLLSIYYCPAAFSDTTWHESNEHPSSTILTLLMTIQVLKATTISC